MPAEDVQTTPARIRRGTWLRAAVVCAALLGLVSAGSGLAAQEDPAEPQAPGSLLSVSGQVVDMVGGHYVVRHDDGRIEVDFSGWPRDIPGDVPIVGIGDNVRVTGRMHADFVRTGTLDAIAVYVEDRHAYFSLSEHAAPGEQPAAPLVFPIDALRREGNASISGAVIALREEGFILASGGVEVSIDTSPLFYDPFDPIGIQRLQAGDLVHVSGTLGGGFPEERVMRAQSVTKVYIIPPAR